MGRDADAMLIALAAVPFLGCTPTPPPPANPLVARDALVAAGAIRGLTAEQVRAVVRARSGDLRACYNLEFQSGPTLAGGVSVSWRVDEGGTVSNVVIVSTLNRPTLEACIVRQVSGWVFPANRAPTYIGSYPFHFGARP